MPPKKAKGGAPPKQKAKEEQHEDALQAVVLADTFERRFSPFTDTRPRCLLPLANTPLIEYTLEFIAQAGIQDVLVYCGAHTDQVEDYLEKSRWKSSSSPFDSLEIVRTEATSVGDAMRDLDNRDLIKGDFVLVSGDVVANIPIEPALAAHKARRQKDPNSIMTMILREAGPGSHRTAGHSKRSIFVINPTQDRCLHYEEISTRRRRRRRMSSSGQGRSKSPAVSDDDKSLHHGRITMEKDVLDFHDEIDIRADLIDPHIDICTPDVLSLWSDNFDYQSMRTSFLFGVLKDFELNGKKLHTHIVNEGYAARVKSIRTYDAVSRDIIEGWAYPFRPDSNLNGQTYRLWKNKVYTERGVVLTKRSRIVRRSIVGATTSVGEGSEIVDSVIGRGCIIGKNVRISNSHVWNDTLIEDGAVLDHNIVAAEAVIGKNTKVQPGALVSFGVRISDDSTVSSTAKLARQSNSGGANTKATPEELAYDSDSSERSSASFASTRLFSQSNQSTGSLSSVSTLHSDVSDEDMADLPNDDEGTPFDARRGSIASASTDLSARHDFVKEVTASVLDGMAQAQSADVIHLDVMNQRLTADASDSAVREALVAAFMRRIFIAHLDEGAAAGDAANHVFKTYGPKILRQMGVRTGTGAAEREADEVEVLNGMERECETRRTGGSGSGGLAAGDEGVSDKVLAFAITAAYNADVVADDAVLRWWREGGGGEERPVRSEAKRLVEFLEQESDDDEEDEEEDEEDSSGEEGSDDDDDDSD